jgi:PAS domain-containing protein/putative methionine-R-sulfoxide reductase with GAF domain
MSSPRTVRSSRIAFSALSRLADDTAYEYSFIVSGRGTISRVNDALLRSTRHRAEALRGKPFSVLICKPDGKPFGPAFLRPRSRSNPLRKNFSILARDGRRLPCRGAAYYFEGGGTGEGGVLVLGTRVRKGAPPRGTILAGAGAEGTLIAALRDGFCVVDSRGVIIESNAALAGMAGRVPAEMAGIAPPYPWFSADDNRRLSETLAGVVKSGAFAHLLVVLEREDNPPLALSFCITPYTGAADRFVAAVRDVSDIVPVHESRMAGKRIERLSEQLQRNSLRLKTLQEINHAVLHSGSLTMVFRQITAGVRRLVDHDLAGIYVFDVEQKYLRPHTLSKLTPFSRRLGKFPITPGEGIIGSTAITGETVLVNDAQYDPRSTYPPGMKPAVEHIIATPLRGRESTYGILTVARNRHPGFNEEDALIVKSFADAASIAIDNIRLHAEFAAATGASRRSARGLRAPIAPRPAGRTGRPGRQAPGSQPPVPAPRAAGTGGVDEPAPRGE